MIAFDCLNKWFYVKGTNQKLEGLHSRLKRKFYPLGSCYENIRKVRWAKGKKKLLTASGQNLRRLSNRQAVGLGKRVDSQMQVLVEAAKGDPLTLRYWVTFKRERTLADYYMKKKTKRPLKKLEPHTAAGIRCLLDHNWVPVACQVPVGSAQHRLATALDVQCRHATDPARFADVEVKTGYDSTWQAHTNQRLNKPLEALWDTDQNKAHLQLACTALLHKATTGAKKLNEMYVLRISGRSGAKLEPLLDSVRNSLQAVANQLVSN